MGEWTAASLLEVGDEDAAAEELSAQADEDGDEEYNEEEGEEQTAPSLLEVGGEDASVEELSVDEQAKLQQELEGEFKRLDTDADGFLDPTNELLFDENIDAKEKEALMEKFDTDKDGKASKSEFIAAAEQLSAQADDDEAEDEENNEEDGEEWTAASLLEVGDEDAAAEELS